MLTPSHLNKTDACMYRIHVMGRGGGLPASTQPIKPLITGKTLPVGTIKPTYSETPVVYLVRGLSRGEADTTAVRTIGSGEGG